jgi:chemotaxis protein MotB
MAHGTSGSSPLDEPEEKENEDRWLLTYSDMMTLLVAFFIMMYSMSVLNLAKFKQVALSIKSGFMGEMEGKKGESVVAEKDNISIEPIVVSNQGAAESTNKATKNNMEAENDAIFSELKLQLINLKISKKLQGIIDIKEKSGNIYIVIVTDKIFFRPGEAALTEDAKAILLDIGALLVPIHNEITVEGYTSTTPPVESKFENNWELSAARSISVINFFIQVNGLIPERLSLTGYGQWRPMFGGAEDAKNDRVVIAIMKKTFKGGK